jgi:hypothetical protein
MHDGGKIVAGLAAFVAIVALPFWHSALSGARAKPEPKLPVLEKQCVSSREDMRANHMDLLNTWRDTVVRKGDRGVVTVGGRNYTMSLSKTCMSCHTSKKEFCDSCHNYLAVAPYCWDCHVAPKEAT